MTWKGAIGAAMATVLTPAIAQADSITAVENARAKERAGYYLDRQDREKLRRYGSNDDYGHYSYGPYGYDGYDGYYADDHYGPGVGIYLGY